MRVAALVGVVLSGGLLVACGAERPSASAARPPLEDEPAPAREAFATPATFRYHPPVAARMTARLELPGGSVLLAGQRGERWLVEQRGQPARAAADLAPEPLVDVLHREAQGAPPVFSFLGASGTVYEAQEPLGPILRSSAPLEPVLRARVAGQVIVGVRRDGALVRSDTALAAWSPVGPEGVRFQDVAIAPDGRGLALAVPEALFETSDFGASFRRLDVPSRGARALLLDPTRAVFVDSILGSFRYAPGREPPLEPAAPSGQRPEEGWTAPLGASAEAITDGRAFVSGDRYTELRRARDGTFTLVSGVFGAPLVAQPIPRAERCKAARLAGAGAFLYLACGRAPRSDAAQVIDLYRSVDAGKTWDAEPYVAEGSLSKLVLAVSPAGGLLASGLCPASASGAGCKPLGVHVRGTRASDAGAPVVALLPAVTPALSGVALGLTFSYDGRTAYALARRSKSDALAVFVSRDGGVTFEPRDVDTLTLPEATDQGLETLAAAEDGTVAFVVKSRGRRQWLVVEEDGRPIALSEPPSSTARVAAAGQRGLAFDPATSDHWESLDGGATWEPLGPLPVDPAGTRTEARDVAFACVARGCVLGERLTRVGWRGARGRPALVTAPERRQRAIPRLRVPYACAVDGAEAQTLPGPITLPDAATAALGGATWYAVQLVEGAGVRVLASRGGGAAPEATTLLPPSPDPAAEAAFAVGAEVRPEGAVAVRYRDLTRSRARTDGVVRDVEVAWSDLLRGRRGRGVIADAGPYRPSDTVPGPRPKLVANTALLGLSPGGAYVRVHGGEGDAQPTYFVDGRSVEVVPPVRWPEGALTGGVSDMVRLGREHVPLRFIDGAVVRATRAAAGFTFDAVTLGAARGSDLGWLQAASTVSLGDVQGRAATLADARGKGAVSSLYLFRSAGAVVDAPMQLPTQLSLADAPRPCTEQDRRSTPRVVAPSLPGTRHAVIVTDGVEPPRTLLTSNAVLHGTPASPCAAAYDAVLAGSSDGRGDEDLVEVALLPLDSLEHSWLFRARRGKKDDRFVSQVSYLRMRCVAEPSAAVPVGVYTAPHTLIDPD